jgi:anti-sigma regulatory factor (Ser/Thr protein kinase)
MTKFFKIPDRQNIDQLFHFALMLDGLKNNENVTFDMGEVRYFPPFAINFLAGKIREIKISKNIQIQLLNHQNHSYLSHVGFFKSIGVEFGRDVGEARGSETYLPLTRLTRSGLYTAPGDRFEEVGDLIQKTADRLASLLSRDYDRKTVLFDALSYSIREILRNVFEHSGCDEVYYCGQYWPGSNKVEISILDHGIGIRESLGVNPNFRFPNDKVAIENSLMPGISGKTHLPRKSENWFNSGYGLYMTNRLCRNGGNFVICSGRQAIKLAPNSKNNYFTSFKGTAVRMTLDINKIGDVQQRLKQFREEAKVISKTYGERAGRPPSAMSLLLRRDFS